MLEAYEDPNVNVRAEIMSKWADDIEGAFEALDNTEFLEEILKVIISVQDELDESTVKACMGGAMDGEECADDTDCPDGACVGSDLVVEGVRLPSPNGAVQIEYTCTGWGETETTDPANGTIDLTMTLEAGRLGPIVWGTAEECRYLAVVRDKEVKSSFDGDVAVHFGDVVPVGQSIRELLVTFLLTGDIGFDDESLTINQSFRIAESGRLDILVQIGEREAFIFFFGGENFAQGVNDATGIFGCSLENRECTTASGTTFSW